MYPTVQLDTIALCYAAKQIFLYQHRKVHLLLTSEISLTISAVKKASLHKSDVDSIQRRQDHLSNLNMALHTVG